MPGRLFSNSIPGSVGSWFAPSDRLSLERALALGRLFLALATFGGGYLDPGEPHAQITETLAALYSIYSLGVLAALVLQRQGSRWLPRGLHAFDVLFAGSLTVLTDAPCSYFVPFFVLLAAGVRWGRLETYVTGGALVGSLFVEALLGFSQRAVDDHVRVLHLATGASYFIVVTILVADLSEWQKRLRETASAAVQIVSLVRPQNGLGSSLRAVLCELRSLFKATSALLVVEEVATGELLLWNVSGGRHQHHCSVHLSELPRSMHESFFFPVPEGIGAWFARQPGSRLPWRPASIAIDAHGQRVDEPVAWPDAFATAHGASAVLCLPEVLLDDFRARLFLLDPQGGCAVPQLRLLQSVAQQSGPPLHNLFLVHRLRSKIGERERAMVAHELHDGVVQSLIGIELQVDVIKRSAEPSLGPAAAGLEHVQGLLREQVVGVRELMQRLRPREVNTDRFVETVSQRTERFSRRTGIQARFVSTLEEVPLPPRACRELANVIDEALVNAWKHSGARKVVVRFGAVNDDLVLTVEDDGRGFPFEGRLEQAELDKRRLAPAVINARLQSIGGHLAIDSRPGRGATLEVFFPRCRYAWEPCSNNRLCVARSRRAVAESLRAVHAARKDVDHSSVVPESVGSGTGG